MSQDNLHILWDREDHPSTELLRQYQEDALPDALSHQLERHLLDCDLCTDVLEGLVVSDAGKTRSALRHINQHIAARTRKKKRKPLPLYLTDWRVAAALFLVLCSTLLVFYYNYKEIRQQEQSIASDSDRVIQESMDLAEAPAVSAPESMADAVPDTVRQTIVTTTPHTTRRKKLPFVPPQIRVQEQEEIVSDAEHPESEAEIILPETPAVAQSAPVTEAAGSIAFQDRNALVPESSSVAKALEGRAAGIKLKSANSVAMKQVQGQVLSSDGRPLPGVAVTIKGTSTGVATDAQGNFTLNLPIEKATLAFSYIGFEREEKTISTGTQHLTVNLQENTSSLSEVVVTGNGKRTAPTQPPVVVAAKLAVSAKAYRKYLEENIRYTSASEKGRVVVQATVSPTGTLQNLQVIKSLCPSCDEEALRLVSQGPSWEPAISNGKKVEQQVKIVVRFNPNSKK
ncbi:energy transducer TonB [Pontibacter ruber]|uniref:TonB family protein n=1 Tax=Pontibacter ruber TaxID=1343895 RepID=A0ABW5CZG5_9BACT|nr:TonB family protein [Pontibacter ruber]